MVKLARTVATARQAAAIAVPAASSRPTRAGTCGVRCGGRSASRCRAGCSHHSHYSHPGRATRTDNRAILNNNAVPVTVAGRKEMLSDERLLCDYLDGDESSLTVLLDRHRGPLLRFLARILGDHTSAEDVAQETFLRLYRAADRFQRDLSFRPWLFRIAANAARDLRRWNLRRAGLSLQAPTPFADDEAGSWIDSFESDSEAPHEQLERSELRGAVREVIEHLPPHHREMLELAYFRQLSYSQISEDLRIPLGTVKSRLHGSVASFAAHWHRLHRVRRG